METEFLAPETVALLSAIDDDIDIPTFDPDLDAWAGTPLEMYEKGELPHERTDGLGVVAMLEAIRAREVRLQAADDIAADDPAITTRVRHRLVDLLLPIARQLALSPAAASPLEEPLRAA